MLFRELRMRRLKTKMDYCARLISDIDKQLEPSDNIPRVGVGNLTDSKRKVEAELEHLTWRYIELKQKRSAESSPIPGIDRDSYKHAKEVLKFMSYPKGMKKEVLRSIAVGAQSPMNGWGPIGDKYYYIDKNGNLNFDQPFQNCTTVKDLEAPMKDKMVEGNPGLQGDLALLLHKLRDPANHPVSLLALAYQVTEGRLTQDDTRLVALALDMLVEEYRKRISSARDFEMSDKACLEALDVERSTVC